VKKIIVMFTDYTDMLRVWTTGLEIDRLIIEERARRLLRSYCAEQAELGEVELADKDNYTMQILALNESSAAQRLY
jgi:hypothetical protein